MSAVVYTSIDELEQSIGVEVGPGDWLELTQERIGLFADATEDHQWIHVDPQRAASGPFGATVAHGFLTLSLIPNLVSSVRSVEGVRMGVNYGLDKVRFPSPVPVGSRVRARTTVTSMERIADDAVQLVTRVTVDIDGADKPACVADTVSRYYF